MDDALLVAVVNGVTDLAEELSEAAVYYLLAYAVMRLRPARPSGSLGSCPVSPSAVAHDPVLIGKFLKHCGLWQQPSRARHALRARRGLCRVIAHTGPPFRGY